MNGLVGGPPCQGFSRIGRREAADPRNNLFLKFFDLVRETVRTFYLAENVPGIMDKVYDTLRAKAFWVLPTISVWNRLKSRASDFGAPTNRKRILFIGYRQESFPVGSYQEQFRATQGYQRDDCP